MELHQIVPPVRKPSVYTVEEKMIRKIDRLVRSLLIQGIPNHIYSLIDSNNTGKELWDALDRQMHGFKFGKQDRKAIVLKTKLNVNEVVGIKKKEVVVTI
nr:hypothetical protein [Tanacetum cinerariifolium]